MSILLVFHLFRRSSHLIRLRFLLRLLAHSSHPVLAVQLSVTSRSSSFSSVRDTVIVPRFVLAELQYFNDSPDGSKRERGRRGLEMLSKMQKEETVKVELSDEDPAGSGADAKLVTLARSLGVAIMTNDYGLNRVAELQGITVLNMNELAQAR